ncbi:MAG: ATP-binding protein [Thermodesulfobacteriota bacterium]
MVNALVHRDYRSTANVQMYIFKDRVEIVSPGGLPAGMTEADLGVKSIPRNPLLFGMLYRMEAVEHIGSGIKRIRNLCREYGVDAPLIEVSEHWFTVIFPRPGVESEEAVAAGTPEATPEVAPEVTPEVQSMLFVFDGEMPRRDIMGALGLSDEKHFREHYQQTAIRLGLIEMTIPDKPRSSKQKYRLTDRGRRLLAGKKKE